MIKYIVARSHRLGGEVARLRAADDFAEIGSRLEELRRERARVWARKDLGSEEPQTHAAGNKPPPADKPRLSPVIRRALFR
jgi:hypothetical protein